MRKELVKMIETHHANLLERLGDNSAYQAMTRTYHTALKKARRDELKAAQKHFWNTKDTANITAQLWGISCKPSAVVAEPVINVLAIPERASLASLLFKELDSITQLDEIRITAVDNMTSLCKRREPCQPRLVSGKSPKETSGESLKETSGKSPKEMSGKNPEDTFEGLDPYPTMCSKFQCIFYLGDSSLPHPA